MAEHEPLELDEKEIPDMVRRGLTPFEVQYAYSTATVGKLADKTHTHRRVILALARRWGLRA